MEDSPGKKGVLSLSDEAQCCLSVPSQLTDLRARSLINQERHAVRQVSQHAYVICPDVLKVAGITGTESVAFPRLMACAH